MEVKVLDGAFMKVKLSEFVRVESQSSRSDVYIKRGRGSRHVSTQGDSHVRTHQNDGHRIYKMRTFCANH